MPQSTGNHSKTSRNAHEFVKGPQEPLKNLDIIARIINKSLRSVF